MIKTSFWFPSSRNTGSHVSQTPKPKTFRYLKSRKKTTFTRIELLFTKKKHHGVNGPWKMPSFAMKFPYCDNFLHSVYSPSTSNFSMHWLIHVSCNWGLPIGSILSNTYKESMELFSFLFSGTLSCSGISLHFVSFSIFPKFNNNLFVLVRCKCDLFKPFSSGFHSVRRSGHKLFYVELQKYQTCFDIFPSSSKDC